MLDVVHHKWRTYGGSRAFAVTWLATLVQHDHISSLLGGQLLGPSQRNEMTLGNVPSSTNIHSGTGSPKFFCRYPGFWWNSSRIHMALRGWLLWKAFSRLARYVCNVSSTFCIHGGALEFHFLLIIKVNDAHCRKLGRSTHAKKKRVLKCSDILKQVNVG